MKTKQTDLLDNMNAIHTTELGTQRICKNLHINTDDVVEWCKEQIADPSGKIIRSGKNWYVTVNGIILTVNAHSYTIITAHKERSSK